VISARGQILTIATDRGDITRDLPDKMASRSDSPKWSPTASTSPSSRTSRAATKSGSRSGRQAPKKITDLDNEKGALVWAPDSKPLLYTAATRSSTLHRRRREDARLTSSDVARIGSVSVSPDSKWVAFSKQDPTLRSHVYISRSRRRRSATLGRQACLLRDERGVDGRRPLHRLHVGEGLSNGIATQGGIQTTMELWATSLRDRDRDPMNRDIDNEAQGLAAEAAARQNAAAARAAARAAGRGQIDWSGLARRARRLTVPGTAIGGLTPAPEGHSVALTVGTGGAAAARRRPARTERAGCTSSTSRAAS
jgi:hypothetical protein